MREIQDEMWVVVMKGKACVNKSDGKLYSKEEADTVLRDHPDSSYWEVRRVLISWPDQPTI